MATHTINPEKMTGPQKAAVFLIYLGVEYAENFFKKVDEETYKKIAKCMAEISTPSSDLLNRVTGEFIDNYDNGIDMLVSGRSFLREVIGKTMDDDTARDLIDELDDSAPEVPFADLAFLPAQNLLNIFKSEHPQTVALIISHLPEEKGAEVLCLFPEELKTDIALRIIQIGEVQDEIIRDIDRTVRSEVSGMGTVSTKLDGVEALAGILNEVDRSTEEAVLSHLEIEDSDKAEMIRQKMFIFEDLLGVDDKSFREILQNVGNDAVARAIKTASEEMKEKIFGNLSERAAEMLREDLEVMGPVKLKEVEDAQQSIIKIAKNLEAEGKVVLAGKGKEDVYV